MRSKILQLTSLSFGPRAAISALGIGAWFFSQALLAGRGFPEGIGDRLHLALTPLTNWLAGHSEAANGLLIVTSAIIDALGCFLLLYGIFGPSVRPLLGLFILFILRQISQALTALPPPEGMIWRYPGFPSLLVTYETANDFFFSGHTAIAVYGAVELARLRRPWLTTASVLIAIIEPLTVLVLRAHYTMDIFTAILAAAWAASVALRLAPSCDRALTRWFTRRSDTKAGALVFSGGGHRCSKEGLADSRIFQENRRLREGGSASENSGR